MLCNWTVNPFHCILRLCLVVSPLTRLRAVGIYRNAASMFVFPKWNENMHAFLWRCRWPEPDGLRLSHVPLHLRLGVLSSPLPRRTFCEPSTQLLLYAEEDTAAALAAGEDAPAWRGADGTRSRAGMYATGVRTMTEENRPYGPLCPSTHRSVPFIPPKHVSGAGALFG
jgi:hypothetical protein